MTPIPLGILDFPTGGASHELIETIELTAPVTSATFSSIPQDYEFLELIYSCKYLSSGGTDLFAYHNGNNVANSITHEVGATTNSPMASTRSENNIRIGQCQQDSYAMSVGRFLFARYNDTNFNTGFLGIMAAPDFSSGWFSGMFNTTDAMTSLEIQWRYGGLSTGDTLSLYGIRGE